MPPQLPPCAPKGPSEPSVALRWVHAGESYPVVVAGAWNYTLTY